jgi:serine/threonine protein phosphatase PrpC
MASTLTALQLVADGWWIVHVGDTRAYVLRDGQLEQLTRDHSVGWEQFEAGAITKEQLRTHPNQNLLTRTVIARRDGVVPDVRAGDVRAGDRFLLCSDGLLKVLDEGRIAETLGQGEDPAAIAQALVERADRLGLIDDTTAVVVLV